MALDFDSFLCLTICPGLSWGEACGSCLTWRQWPLRLFSLLLLLVLGATHLIHVEIRAAGNQHKITAAKEHHTEPGKPANPSLLIPHSLWSGLVAAIWSTGDDHWPGAFQSAPQTEQPAGQGSEHCNAWGQVITIQVLRRSALPIVASWKEHQGCHWFPNDTHEMQ